MRHPLDLSLAQTFVCHELPLDCGMVLPEARLRWLWRGPRGQQERQEQQGPQTPAGPGSPALEPILACTAFAASPLDLAYLSEAGAPLDASDRPVLHVELLGNGRSSSPSNTPPPWAGPQFPRVSIGDNVRLQAALLQHLGIERLHAVIGASMGAAQALHWAVHHPKRVGRAVLIAGHARTTFYGRLFLHTVKSALLSDPAFAGGNYQRPPLAGLTRLSETWAAFALSPRFFTTGRHLVHPDMSAPDLEGFLAKWGTRYHTRDANDLLCHLAMWDAHDVNGSTDVPLLFLPISTDAYFHPDDVREQAAAFPKATVQVIASLSGHAAAFGREAADRQAIGAAVAAFLQADLPHGA